MFGSCAKKSLETETDAAQAGGNGTSADAVVIGSLEVDAWSHERNYTIQSDGSWSVESSRFITCEPSVGTGDTEVKLYVQDNLSGVRKDGKITIVSPGAQNRVVAVEQLCADDYTEEELGAHPIGTSNKIYAVGYSYDARDEYASPNSVRLEVFDTRRLIKSGILAKNATDLSLHNMTLTGSTISEIRDTLSSQVNGKASWGLFAAEMNTSFNMGYAKSDNYEYAVSYVDLKVYNISLEKDLETIKDRYMMDDAYNAINGIPVRRRSGRMEAAYPTDAEGIKRLVRDYGTHVVMNAGLGGRVRYSMSVNISNITTNYDAGAFIKASYGDVSSMGVSAEVRNCNS